jgi:hypothetical protein
MRYEIIIAEDLTSYNPNTYLDTFDDESISLNYNIADIADIANKNSSYSKTIKLPDTGVNRKAFTDIFNIESTSPYWTNDIKFNPNKKVRCWVLKDTLIQFAGNIQLTSVVYEYDTQNFYYECVIYADNDNLFKVLADRFLSDLDFSAFDHLWSYNNIVQSWTDDYRRGYYYPLIDYGMALNLSYLQNDSRNSTNFLPAIYVKTVINQIFTEAGFTYKSDFFNEDTFNNLILPFNNKNLIPSYPDLYYDKNGIVCAVGLSNTIDVNSNTVGNVDWANLGFNNEIYDPNNFYNTSTVVYKNGLTASTTQRFTVYLSILMTAGNIATNEAPWQSWSDNIRVWCVRSKFPDGSNVPGWSATPDYFDFVNYPTITWDNGQNVRQIRSLVDDGAWEKIDAGNNNYVIRGKISTSYFFPPLRKNEEVRFFITRSINNQAANPATIVGTASYFQSEVNLTQASENAFLEMKNVVPTNVKQKDFLASIIRMFNLIIEPDPDIDNNFIIEPKDYYYKKYSVFKDWSQKLDLNAPISTQLLSNTQLKTNLFTYKADKDFYNQKYTETDSKIFGEYRYDIDNDFLSGDKKIELIFSPTPLNELAPIGSGIYLPSIYQMSNGNITKMDGMNIRILYKSPISLTASNYIKLNGNLQSIYPYAGYVDNPLNPSMSLNFGDVNSFYTGYNETQNNLFYNYYQRTIDLLQDRYSKLVTAEINLDAYDINTFRFSDLIYLTIGGMSGYYRVNKIIDYDPSKEQPTKVEFITAINYNNGLTIEDSCAVTLTQCFIGDDLTSFLNKLNEYQGTLTPYFTLATNAPIEDTTFQANLNTDISVPPTVESVISWVNTNDGLQATYYPGVTQCTLNFEVEMGEEAANTFVGTLNYLWDNSPENGGSGPDPYVVIYINYPCGATFGTWDEYNNTYFWDLSGYNDQYTFLDWWLANIPGAYGTASGEVLAEGAYLKLGWNWTTDCISLETVGEIYFTINLDPTEAQNLVDVVNTNFDGDCTYLTFWNTYANAAYNYDVESSANTIEDIITWANTIYGMSASLHLDGSATFYYRQDGVICGTESYVAKLTMNTTIGSPAPTYVCLELYESAVESFPCSLDCFGTCLQLYIAQSTVNYLPGGWTPDLFVAEPILGPTSGVVYEAGGLTYGVCQDLCLCSEDTLCFEYTSTLPCPGGQAYFIGYISTGIPEEVVESVFEAPSVTCECTTTLDPINYRPQIGNTIPVSQDIVFVGNISTNPSNTFNDVNNIAIGRDNFVNGSNNSVSGDGNAVSGNSNIVSGNGNSSTSNNVFIMGASISNSYTSDQPSFLFGNNIENYSKGSFLVGNNIQIGVGTNSNTISATGSTTSPPPSNLFLVGSNITITDANTIPSDTTYLGSENIIIDPNGGFNTPFIISEVSTPDGVDVNTVDWTTDQNIIKTFTGFTKVAANSTKYVYLTSGTPPITTTNDFSVDSPVVAILKVRMLGSDLTCGLYSGTTLFQVSNSIPQFTFIGNAGLPNVTPIPFTNFTVTLDDTGTDITMTFTSNSLTLSCDFYWTLELQYRWV